MAGHMPDKVQAELGDYDTLYGRLLADQGIDLVPWAVCDMVFPPGIHAAEGWLISGSRFGAYEDLPWIARLEDFIREAYAADVPIVGICFGHQVVAQALGGRVEKYAGGWAAGRHEYDWHGEPLVLNAWHQDQVVEKPPEARTVAQSPFCEHAALVYPGKAFTVQPHPEFDRRAVELLLETRAPGVVPDDRIAAAREALDQPTDAPRLAAEIGDFFRETLHV